MAGDARGAGDDLAHPRPTRDGRRRAGRPARRRWGTGRSRPKPARSPTGWTRTGSWPGPGTPSETAGSPCGRPRTRWPGSPRCSPSPKASPPTPRWSRQPTTARAGGDPRGRGQVMADTLVERVTGQATADAVPVEINLVMTDHTLFNTNHHTERTEHADQQPARPATRAARMMRLPRAARVSRPPDRVRADPGRAGPRPRPRQRGHQGVGAAALHRPVHRAPRRDGHPARPFTGQIRHAIIIRDQLCRTPGAAPRSGTPTTPNPSPTAAKPASATGKACAKPATTPNKPPAGPPPGPGGTSESVIITTPTGHTYTSRPPDLPGTLRAQPGQRAGPAPPTATDHAA